jgi:predicted cation transporter
LIHSAIQATVIPNLILAMKEQKSLESWIWLAITKGQALTTLFFLFILVVV